MRESLWGGLDVRDYTTRVCVTDNEGTPVVEMDVESQPALVADVLAAFECERFRKIGMEAGPLSNDIARYLIERGYPAAIYDARRVNRFLSARPTKTDRNDARGIAQLARLGPFGLREVHIKSREIQELRNELVLRETMIRQRMIAEASLKSTFRVNGVRLGITRTPKVLREKCQEAFASLGAGGADLQVRLAPLIELCVGLREYEALQNKALLRRCRGIEVVSRFLEIPSVGPISALSFYTAIEDPTRFASANDVGAYLGLTPRTSQSGKTLRQGRITKFGNVLTRTHLVMAARSMLGRDRKAESALRSWGQALASRSTISRARVAVARKLATVMLAMWRDGTRFQPEGLQRAS